MKFSRITSAVMAAAFVAVLALSAVSARAADLIVVDGSPALKFVFGTFERRGVTLADQGVLVVRNDGCWRADMEVLNGSGYDSVVSVVMRFTTPRGRHYVDLVLLDSALMANATVLDIAAEGCSNALAAAFYDLQGYGVRRVFSVR